MGVLSTLCKNDLLNAFKGTAPSIPCTHLGLFQADAGKALTTPFGVAATDIFTCTGHGYSAGDVVLITALTGGAGLKAGTAGNADENARIYFISATNLAANTFSLALVPGGALVDFTTDITVGTVTRVVEISGGAPAYARKTVTYAAAASGAINDSANGTPFDVPVCTVDYISYHSAVTAGSLLGLDKLATAEPFAAQGTYTVTDSNVDLMTTNTGA